ncbi:hypothetical protein ACTXT7_008815 [Hymenolepis weldensis]
MSQPDFTTQFDKSQYPLGPPCLPSAAPIVSTINYKPAYFLPVFSLFKETDYNNLSLYSVDLEKIDRRFLKSESV